MFSHYGIASAVLGVLSVAAVVLGVFIWNGTPRRGERTRLPHSRDADRRRLDGCADQHEQRQHRRQPAAGPRGTVGELNSDFDAAVQPYRQVVEKLQSQSAGRIEAVAIETVHHDLDAQAGVSRPVVTTKLPPFASRTDSVMLVATSVSENAGAKPQTVHWSLRLDVTNVDGKLIIFYLELIR